MKNMKRIAGLLLALVLVLAMVAPAFAAGEGSITINGASEDNVYSIYRVLDLESYNTTSGAYSYKLNSAWEEKGFLNDPVAATCLTVDDVGYITWTGGDSAETVANFAKAALAFAQENGIDAVKSTSNDGDFTYGETGDPKIPYVKFENLDLGYYLIDSTMGALCGLTTTNPNASINAKNAAPEIDKQVQEDSTGQWGDNSTADIGQTVNFRTTINVHAGAQNYVLHDTMSAGLTFTGVAKIEHVVPETATTTELTAETDYTVVSGEALGNHCTFEVRFSNDFCDDLETNDKLIVYYSAMLNKNAVIAGDGNPNNTHLSFGEDHNTAPDNTVTKTFAFDIVKTDSQNTLLNGAEFRIYDAPTNGNEVPVVLMDDGVTYRRARADETGVNIVVKDGKVRVVGFDNGTYYLEEVVTPSGYNKLAARQRFIIADGNLDSIFNDGTYSTGSGVHVVNKTGTMLPETGGIGTTLFYVAGGILVAAAVVLLVTRKRMSEK